VTGNDGAGLVIQQRDVELLRELDHLRVTDRDDARLIAGFRSRTRVNSRLLKLSRAGLLLRKAAGTTSGGHKFLYALSPRGARYIGRPFRAPIWNNHTTLAWSPSLEHQLTLNRVYLALKQPPAALGICLKHWRTFSTPISATARLIPDAYAELQTGIGCLPVFVEVDRGTESLRIIRQKIAAYIDLATSSAFTRIFRHERFRVALFAPSLRRLKTIRHQIALKTDKLFWLSVFASNPTQTFWDRSWLRPSDPEMKTFL
jgi:hypothetical protein